MTAGFTGARCAFTVMPKTLKGKTRGGAGCEIHKWWTRRHTTKFNGVSYITQRGAEAVYTPEGNRQVRQTIAHYMNNAKLIEVGTPAELKKKIQKKGGKEPSLEDVFIALTSK